MAVTISWKCIFSQSERLHFQNFPREHAPGLPGGSQNNFGGYFEAPKTLNSSHGPVLRPPKITMRTFDNRFQLQQTLTQSPK